MSDDEKGIERCFAPVEEYLQEMKDSLENARHALKAGEASLENAQRALQLAKDEAAEGFKKHKRRKINEDYHLSEKDRRLAELHRKDLQMLKNQFFPRFYHQTEPFPLTNVSFQSVGEKEKILGEYELIYTVGNCEGCTVSRAIPERGTLKLFMLPRSGDRGNNSDEQLIWGAIEYDCTQSEDDFNLFERDCCFLQNQKANFVDQLDKEDKGKILKGKLYDRVNGYDGFPEVYDNMGGKEWIQGISWKLKKLSQDFECKWDPDEYEGRGSPFEYEGRGESDDKVEFRQERIELMDNRANLEKSWIWNHMKLPELGIVRTIYEYLLGVDVSSINKLQLKRNDLSLYIEWDWGGYGVESWTDTIARRLPEDKQGDRSKYIRPLPLPDDGEIYIDRNLANW